MKNKMSILTVVTDPDIPAMPAAMPTVMPATRTCSIDSDSLSGSLSDSCFASSPSTPPTIDTAATSDDDEQHEGRKKEVARESSRSRIMTMEGHHHHHHHHHHLASSTESNPNPKPKPSRNSSFDSSPSLLRTTLLSFARFGLSTSSTRSSTSCSSPSRSRCVSISISDSGSDSGSGPSSTGSPLPSPTSLHAKSTTEICTNSNPSLAQFIPTPRASSSLARYSYSSSSISRPHFPRSRSVSNVQTAHVGSSLRLRTQPFDDLTSTHTHSTPSVTPPFSFWRKRTTPHSHSHSHSHTPHPSPLVLPSISRAHVPDYLPDPAFPIDKANPSSRSSSGSPSIPCPSGFLKIDGSRDGLSFRAAENATRGNGANLIVGTPRPSYPIGLGPEHDDIMVTDSPVGEDDDGQPNNENVGQCKVKGKGEQPVTIPARLSAPSASIPIPSQQQLRVKIILPPPPVRASTTPLPNRTKPTLTPPTLTSVEKSSRLMRDRVHCATCATAGVDFPRCPRCAEAWCSRECRVARMDELPDGRRKHVCKA